MALKEVYKRGGWLAHTEVVAAIGCGRRFLAFTEERGAGAPAEYDSGVAMLYKVLSLGSSY